MMAGGFASVLYKQKELWFQFSETMDREQDIRLSGYQRIREFKNNNFQINKILNINTKLCRPFFEINRAIDRVYNIYTIKQEKRRYEDLAGVLLPS